MTEDINYKRKCCDCGEYFETSAPKTKLCPHCRAIRESITKRIGYEKGKIKKERKSRLNTYDAVPVVEFVHLIQVYNKKHNTSYSYGQIQSMLNEKRISIKDLKE